MTIRALFKFAKNPYGGIEIDTTSNSGEYSDLSPFVLDATKYGSKNFENLWQYSKVYPEFLDDNGNAGDKWYEWRYYGFNSIQAHRYPMGKGRIPCFSLWNGKRLAYIDARKQIYATIYAELVIETKSYKLLEQLYHSGAGIILRDYDAYDHNLLGLTLIDVINNPNRKCGHAFILIMTLTNQLEECIKS